MQTPDFWYNQKTTLSSVFLRPFSWIYGLIGAIRRDRTKPWRSPIPIICVGNLVAGGQGKTPTAIAIGKTLNGKNKSIHFMSRGYGASHKGPLLVDLRTHTANDVGDEPLLLSETSPTWICKDRKAGIELAYKMGAEIIVMDDGFQNPSIVKDLSIIVIDGEVGFGNGHLIPAGPLREGVTVGLSRADATVIIGDDKLGLQEMLVEKPLNFRGDTIKILTARLKPDGIPPIVQNKKVFAFAGIGRPAKFFNTVLDMGYNLVGTESFPDHHVYSKSEILNLNNKAKYRNAKLITTSKDYIRLPASLQKDIAVIPVTLDWSDTNALDSLLKPFI